MSERCVSLFPRGAARRHPGVYGFIFLGLLAASMALAQEEDARFEQKLGATLPLDTVFVDQGGAQHRLRDWFQGRPVVMYFGYARCPQLCNVVADTTVAALRQIKVTPGRDFEVVTISIDPEESRQDAHARWSETVHRYGDTSTAAGWHYLRGVERAIRGVAAAVGFHYRYDPRSRQYAHPAGFLVVTPAGVVSQYFPGLEFSGHDVARAIQRAARGESGEPVADVLLRCFRGDWVGGRYGALIWRVLEIAVSATVLALAGGVGWMLWQERRGGGGCSLVAPGKR